MLFKDLRFKYWLLATGHWQPSCSSGDCGFLIPRMRNRSDGLGKGRLWSATARGQKPKAKSNSTLTPSNASHFIIHHSSFIIHHSSFIIHHSSLLQISFKLKFRLQSPQKRPFFHHLLKLVLVSVGLNLCRMFHHLWLQCELVVVQTLLQVMF